MNLSAGARIGPYEVVGLLGAGAMAQVYRAHDPRVRRDVALKVLPLAYASDADRLRRFEHEMRAVGALSHPNVVALYDVGSIEGTPFLVTELVEGETLRQLVMRGPVSTVKAALIAAQIASGVGAAHAREIVHRDLKPENVVITRSGTVKVLDFGIAKMADTATQADVATLLATLRTEDGLVVGTPGYMAPEQLQGLEVDPRADVFAIGAMLYEMLVGRPAFRRDSIADTVSATLRDDPPQLDSLSALAPSLAPIVRRCLARDRDARFHSAADLAFSLEIATQTHPANANADPPRAGSSARRALLVTTGVLLLGAALTLSTLLRPRDRELPPTITRFEIEAPQGQSFANTPALAPDGRQLVFVAVPESTSSRSGTADQAQRLWLRRFDSDEAILLEGTEGAAFPFWSPDSRAVGFFADGKLKVLDLLRRAALTIAAAPSGRGGVWGKDGQIIFAPTAAGGLSEVSAHGGAVLPVTVLRPSESSHRMPFVADDDTLGFYAMNKDPAVSGVWLKRRRDKTAPTELVKTGDAAQFASGFLFFISDGTLLAQRLDIEALRLTGMPIPIVQNVASSGSGTTSVPAMAVSAAGTIIARRSRPGVTQFTWISRTGRATLLALPPGPFGQPELAPDGSRLAYVRTLQGSRYGELWTADLVRGSTTRATIPGPGVTTPLWSRDGKHLVVASPRGIGGNQNLYEVLADTAVMSPTAEGAAGMTPCGWLRDGLCAVVAETPPAVAFNSIAASPQRFTVFFRHGFAVGTARSSPDGEHVAFTSEQSGRPEVYLLSRSAATTALVSSNGGRQPRWGKDGTELFYLSPEGNIMAVAFGRDGSLGIPATVASVHTRLSTNQYDYDVDLTNRNFLVAVEQRRSSDVLAVVLNWSADQHQR